jgi:hypothetical protein
MVEAAQSYEMVCKFNNFKAFVVFAVKNCKPFLSWTKNSEYSFFNPENFFLSMIMLVRKIFLNYLPPPPPPPPTSTTFSGKICTT